MTVHLTAPDLAGLRVLAHRSTARVSTATSVPSADQARVHWATADRLVRFGYATRADRTLHLTDEGLQAATERGLLREEVGTA